MAFCHGKETVITVAGIDISIYTKSSELEKGADSHDITCYGADDYSYSGGLGSGKFKMEGVYNSAAAGPRATLLPLVGTVVAIIRRTEGTGSGLPQDSFNLLIDKYVETNPVAGMVTWSCDGTKSGALDSTAQA
jgi:hypothetical protein